MRYPTYVVIKTSVYLDEEEKRRLAALAAATGTSEAELLRRGVGLVLAQAERPRPRLGVAASSDGRSAREVDDLLAESGFGSR
jgi:Ribbon-helix-helix protein, copG family